MIRFVEGKLTAQARLGILPAAFNPPTVAHVALADAAQERFALDQVAFVLPETLPHKKLDGNGFAQRLEWIGRLARGNAARLAACCERGLVGEIAQEFRGQVPASVELYVIGGRDAAERFISWDYAGAPLFDEQLRHFQLLVGSRAGTYAPAPRHAGRIHPFEIAAHYDAVSATAVRERRAWSAVPRVIRDSVRRALAGGAA